MPEVRKDAVSQVHHEFLELVAGRTGNVNRWMSLIHWSEVEAREEENTRQETTAVQTSDISTSTALVLYVPPQSIAAYTTSNAPANTDQETLPAGILEQGLATNTQPIAESIEDTATKQVKLSANLFVGIDWCSGDKVDAEITSTFDKSCDDNSASMIQTQLLQRLSKRLPALCTDNGSWEKDYVERLKCAVSQILAAFNQVKSVELRACVGDLGDVTMVIEPGK